MQNYTETKCPAILFSWYFVAGCEQASKFLSQISEIISDKNLLISDKNFLICVINFQRWGVVSVK